MRLVECVQAMLRHEDRSAAQLLGEVDALKLRSCLTLFAAVAPHQACFAQALQRFHGGQADPAASGPRPRHEMPSAFVRVAVYSALPLTPVEPP